MNPCRHYDADQWVKGGNPCRIGHNLAKIVDSKLPSRSPFYLRKLFCINGRTDILDCPSVDRMTDEEHAAHKAQAEADMKEAMDTFITVILPNKADMIEKNEWMRTIKCPRCGADLHIGLVELNGHLRVACSGCTFGVME